MSYYGRHYISHRSEEYVQQIKQENIEYIESFNAKNKEAYQTVEGQLVKGGESFVMEPNKFITFTDEEFQHLFTGLLPSNSQSNLRSSHKAETSSQTNHKLSLNNQQEHSVSQQIFDHTFVSRVDPDFSHETEDIDSHQKEMLEHDEEEKKKKADFVFENPFELNDTEIDQMYGKANSDDSWGWDWKSFDPDYYDTEEDTDQLSDFDTYWKKWEDDHWGYDDEDALKDAVQSPWFQKWLEEAEKNADNPDWWGLDEQDQTNGKQKHEGKSKRAFPVYPDNATEVNWAKLGATTHVKNQGNCGSCWAFSALGVIEANYLINGKGTLDLSEQQLVDCQNKDANGCNGASGLAGFQYAIDNGVVTEDKYPYRGIQQKCIQKEGPHKIESTNVVWSFRSNIEKALRRGPVFAQLRYNTFRYYKKGIFSLCDPGLPNHGIVIVGYTKDYWIVRNSWGADWGENGHIRIKKDQNKGNACAIQSFVIEVNPPSFWERLFG